MYIYTTAVYFTPGLYRSVEGDSQKAVEIQALVGSTEASFTGERLRKALIAAENEDEAKKREGDDLDKIE